MHSRGVLVVVGSGAMGLACAQRLGGGRHILLADYSSDRLKPAVDALRATGHAVRPVDVDVTDPDSVAALAEAAAAAGELDVIVHTAGISPLQGTSRQIFRVDLYGAALVIDRMFSLARRATVMTVISSGGAYALDIPAETERLLATTPTESLLDLPVVNLESPDRRWAYHVSKRALQVRVQAEAARWGERGARINTVSPGITATPMAANELKDPGRAERTRDLLGRSPAGRMGTPDDIAAAVAFLSSAEASYITGTDLLVDGGLVGFRRWQEKPGSNELQ
jgi:NAD(P)-dependent dehydrogenase (short-subunit alcohol dehydrogenase family)